MFDERVQSKVTGLLPTQERQRREAESENAVQTSICNAEMLPKITPSLWQEKFDSRDAVLDQLYKGAAAILEYCEYKQQGTAPTNRI